MSDYNITALGLLAIGGLFALAAQRKPQPFATTTFSKPTKIMIAGTFIAFAVIIFLVGLRLDR